MRAAVISDRLVADCDRFEPVVISVNIVQFNVDGYPGGPCSGIDKHADYWR